MQKQQKFEIPNSFNQKSGPNMLLHESIKSLAVGQHQETVFQPFPSKYIPLEEDENIGLKFHSRCHHCFVYSQKVRKSKKNSASSLRFHYFPSQCLSHPQRKTWKNTDISGIIKAHQSFPSCH